MSALDSLALSFAIAPPDTLLEHAPAPGLAPGDPAMIAAVAAVGVIVCGVALGIAAAKFPELWPRWRGWHWDGE